MNKKAIIFLVIGIVLITGIYSFIQSQKEELSSSPLVIEKVFEFSVALGKVTGPSEMKVTEGDAVTFKVSSDMADELHLHGYDLSFDIEKGIPAEISFTADVTGRFDVELHHSEGKLGALEVFPK